VEESLGLWSVGACEGDGCGEGEQVGGGDVGAYGSGALRPCEQGGGGRLHCLVPAVEEGGASARVVVGDCEGKRSLVSDMGDEGAQPHQERVVGRGVVEKGFSTAAELVDLIGVDGDEQVGASWEMAVKSRVADTGAAGYFVQGRVGALLGEELLRRCKESLGAASGVRALRSLDIRGHPRLFMRAFKWGDPRVWRTSRVLGPGEVHHRLVEAWNDVLAGRVDEALELIDPEIVDHRGGAEGDHVGREAWRRKWEGFADLPFPDILGHR
jgi:hypothetical protein